MKKNILFIALLCFSIVTNAGSIRLKNGVSAYWEDFTEVIRYNSYRVEVRLTDFYDENVWGDVALISSNGDVIHGNLFIRAGELKGYVDFEGLNNNARYSVRIRLNND